MFWNETNLYWISYNFSNYSFHNCPSFKAKCLNVSLNHCFQDALPCSRKLAKAKVTEASWYNKVSVLTSLYGMSLAYSHDWYPIKYIHLAIQCLIFIVAGMYVICFWNVLNKRPVILKFLNKIYHIDALNSERKCLNVVSLTQDAPSCFSELVEEKESMLPSLYVMCLAYGHYWWTMK